MRALYVPWDLALKQGGRLLDDIGALTKVDTLMLMDLFSAKVTRGKRQVAYLDSRVVLPPGARFDVPVNRMGVGQFRSLTAFMEDASSRGFKVASLIAPLFVCGGVDSMACVDVTGRRLHVREKTIFYGCPNNEGVVEYGRRFMDALVDSWPVLDYVLLDHLEY